MVRIICGRLLVLIRLAIIVSLAATSVANAGAAMHGQIGGPDSGRNGRMSEMSLGMPDCETHGGRSQNDHAFGPSVGTPRSLSAPVLAPEPPAAAAKVSVTQLHDGEDAGKVPGRQGCCKDFCAGLAILAEGGTLPRPVVASVLRFIDERGLPGLLFTLHRPPGL